MKKQQFPEKSKNNEHFLEMLNEVVLGTSPEETIKREQKINKNYKGYYKKPWKFIDDGEVFTTFRANTVKNMKIDDRLLKNLKTFFKFFVQRLK